MIVTYAEINVYFCWNGGIYYENITADVFLPYLPYVTKSLCVQQHQSVSFFIEVRDTPHPDAFGLWFNSAAESKAWDNHNDIIIQDDMHVTFKCIYNVKKRPNYIILLYVITTFVYDLSYQTVP